MRPLLFCLLLAVVPSGCDLPTRIPLYETRWSFVLVRDSIATADLLPAGFRATDEGFVIDSWSSEGHIRLGDVCEVCTCFKGSIPSMELAPYDWRLTLPGGLVSAEIVRGTARLVLENHVGFDVLDDGEGHRGFLAVSLMDAAAGRSLGQAIVAEPFPPDGSVTLSFDLSGVVLGQNLVARLHGHMVGSGCKEVVLTAESGFATRVELVDVLAPSAEVWVGDGALSMPERSVALPAAVAERLRPGEASLVLEVVVESSLPADVEIGMSAAARTEDLFTGRAALYTPLLIPGGAPELPRTLERAYVVQVGPLHGAERIHLDTRNRFLVNRPMRLRGGESVAFRAVLRAEVPSR